VAAATTSEMVMNSAFGEWVLAISYPFTKITDEAGVTSTRL